MNENRLCAQKQFALSLSLSMTTYQGNEFKDSNKW